MDRSEVKAIVDRELEPLMERLGIPHWHVKVEYGPIDGGDVTGQCTRLLDYNMATVELDPERIDDEAGALKVLRHELFHVVLSPFDLYSSAVDHAGATEDLHKVLDRVWRHACEKAVINLERLFQGLTEGDSPRSRPRKRKGA